MPALIVVGAQWGDEGKGKIVDYLANEADWVVRFQGGNNAGHTLVVGNRTTKLSLIPSGILRTKTRCAIATGVVVDPVVLVREMEQLRAAGVVVNEERLVIDRDAHLILPYHQILDEAREQSLGGGKIGTTGRGIGPAYTDRAARCGVRFADLREMDQLHDRLLQQVALNNCYLKDVLKSSQPVEFEKVWEVVVSAAEVLLPYVGNVSLLLDRAIKQGERVVFEGAQGTLLDQMHGTVPYVTSSNTIAGAATVGSGLGPGRFDYVVGVAKAYSTRVGEGPFPTELHDQIGARLAERGVEFGTVTGRPRRCGWFDAFAVKRAVRLNGIDALALTKLDILTGFEQIRVCIGYELDGELVEDVPTLSSELGRVVPRYIELEGWQQELGHARKWHHLPPAARLYLDTISEYLGCPVAVVSIGPERDDTIVSKSEKFVRRFVQ